MRVVSDRGEQDVQQPNWARFALMGAVGTVFTFAANGHEEKYTVTNDSAQTIFITAGMVLEDSALPSAPGPGPRGLHAGTTPAGGAAVHDHRAVQPAEPVRLEHFRSNMTLVKVGSSWCR